MATKIELSVKEKFSLISGFIHSQDLKDDDESTVLLMLLIDHCNRQQIREIDRTFISDTHVAVCEFKLKLNKIASASKKF